MKSILDRSFRYTPSARTDLRKTFARIRREQRVQERDGAEALADDKLRPQRAGAADAQRGY